MIKTGFELMAFANAVNYMRPSIWYNIPTQGLKGGIIGLKGIARPGKFFSPWNPILKGAAQMPGAVGKFARDFAKQGLAGQPGTWGEVGKFMAGEAAIGKFNFSALGIAGTQSGRLAASLQKTSLRQLYNIGFSNMGTAEAAMFYQRFASPITSMPNIASRMSPLQRMWQRTGSFFNATVPSNVMYSGIPAIPEIRAAAKWAVAGKVAGGLMTGINVFLWGKILGTLAYSTLKGVGTAAGTFSRVMPGIVQGIRSLEFGSGYAPQFQTSGALTERQRAIDAIQRHNLNARRFLGNEASLSPNQY